MIVYFLMDKRLLDAFCVLHFFVRNEYSRRAKALGCGAGGGLVALVKYICVWVI